MHVCAPRPTTKIRHQLFWKVFVYFSSDVSFLSPPIASNSLAVFVSFFLLNRVHFSKKWLEVRFVCNRPKKTKLNALKIHSFTRNVLNRTTFIYITTTTIIILILTNIIIIIILPSLVICRLLRRCVVWKIFLCHELICWADFAFDSNDDCRRLHPLAEIYFLLLSWLLIWSFLKTSLLFFHICSRNQAPIYLFFVCSKLIQFHCTTDQN